MCGIFGFCSDNSSNAIGTILDGLSSLEYRGYDSAGIAFFKGASLGVIKSRGKVERLRELACELGSVRSKCGIGHTRWATHGEPSDANSHPHGSSRVQIVHNGIIENYRELEGELREDGYSFKSETDTETVALLIDKYYKKTSDPRRAILRACSRLKGSFALGIVFCDYPNTIYAIRKSSPLIASKTDKSSFICSDITALLPHTRKYYVLPEMTLCALQGGNVSFFDTGLSKITLEEQTAQWSEGEARRDGYAHFMLKEIHEQAEAIRRTLHARIVDGAPSFDADGIDFSRIARSRRLILVGCGTAYHACLIGKHYLEAQGLLSEAHIASEFRYSTLPLTSEDTVIAISQSGETADTLSAIKRANEAGAYTIGIVNVIASSCALASERVIYTMAGPEISVASTKAYVIQCSVLCLFALALGAHLGKIESEALQTATRELTEALPDAIDKITARKNEIRHFSRLISGSSSLFFIGRGVDYPCVLEASLKLKEISYIHSEAYPAGELKHGTISLIESGVPVIALSCVDNLTSKMESNIREVASRGALVIRVQSAECDDEHSFVLPPLCEWLRPLMCASFFQLLAYFCALERGCDIDHPRNLAKSVTVE